jgi:hypothetical protein
VEEQAIDARLEMYGSMPFEETVFFFFVIVWIG